MKMKWAKLAFALAIGGMVAASGSALAQSGGPLEIRPDRQVASLRPANHSTSRPAIRATQRQNFSNDSGSRQVTYQGARLVNFSGDFKPGSIIIRTAYKKLYFVLGDGQAIEYGIGVGREGYQWSGTEKISRKAEWPDWYPPKEMREREPDLPEKMEGGLDNPLGARALYLGNTLYRIHGTSAPWTIGKEVSSGCIRMLNEEVVDLFRRAEIGAKVYVF